MGKIKDMTGSKFGKLTVIKFAGINKNHLATWECLCECGNVAVVLGNSLRTGNTTSCGCVFKDNSKRWYRHGDSHNRLHNLWNGMIQRCSDVNSNTYHRYGGRGIKVCDEWLVYENFRDWAISTGYDAFAPFGKCSLDRIDNEGNYEPSNCRWVSLSEQAKNKSNSRYFTYRGKTLTIREWSDETGIKYRTLVYRIDNNWDTDRVFKGAKHYI